MHIIIILIQKLYRTNRAYRTDEEKFITENRYADYDLTMLMLCESMDMYLPTSPRAYMPLWDHISETDVSEDAEEKEYRGDFEKDLAVLKRLREQNLSSVTD